MTPDMVLHVPATAVAEGCCERVVVLVEVEAHNTAVAHDGLDSPVRLNDFARAFSAVAKSPEHGGVFALTEGNVRVEAEHININKNERIDLLDAFDAVMHSEPGHNRL